MAGWFVFFAVAIVLVLYAVKMDYSIWKYFHDIKDDEDKTTQGGVIMREIKFRGKIWEGGRWIYGSLLVFPDGDTYMLYDVDFADSGNVNKDPVLPGTIGQFTGLTDKNGKEIYEGDVVRWDKDKKNYVVTFRSGMFYASVEECNPGIYGGFSLWFLCVEEQQCVVVGNIHDNPELIQK